MSCRLSIIIPTLNEAQILGAALRELAPYRKAGHEVIVADGGSTDGTIAIAEPLADRVVHSPPGRARQMNASAAAANGDILLFLHADTALPKHAAETICEGVDRAGAVWGRFDVALSGRHPLLRMVAFFMNLRSRLTGIATGDQAMFMRRETFKDVRGFPDIPLMEDIALSATLKRMGRPLCLRQKAITSSRRWESKGILRTIARMWGIRLAYALGVRPAVLARWY